MKRPSTIIVAIALFITLTIVGASLIWDTMADVAYVMEANR